jgi:drug/metabolite transporter (DMT)-like permease
MRGQGFGSLGLDACGGAPYTKLEPGAPLLPSAVANRTGIVAMLTAMTLFTANDTLLKVATADLPPGQIMAVRGVFAVALVLALIAGRGEARRLPDLCHPVVLLRAGAEALIAFLFITSLAQLPIANVNAILQATPIIITLIAVALGLEQVGWRRWSAVLIGFAGVLLIVKPSVSGLNPYAALALGSAALVAVRDLVTRRVGHAVPTAVITLAAASAVMLAGFALALTETWRQPTAREIALLALAAVFVSLGNLAIVKAFRVGEISVVSPFRYSVILTSLLAGYAVFGEWPDLVSCLGIALVVASGLYTLHREQRRVRDTRTAEARVAVAGEPL